MATSTRAVVRDARRCATISESFAHFFHVFTRTGPHSHRGYAIGAVPGNPRVTPNRVDRVCKEVPVRHLVDEALELLLASISGETHDSLQLHFEHSAFGVRRSTP